MRPLITTPFADMSDDARRRFVDARRAARTAIQPKRVRGRTVASLSKAWALSPAIIIEAARSLMPQEPKNE